MDHDPAAPTLTLLGAVGCGSAIVEAALELAQVPYRLEMLDEPWNEGDARERLRAVNPLLQVPTLLLPGGAVMTETAAMVLYLADLAPEAGLVPAAGEAARPAFLRWLVYLVASLYPSFTYGDVPSRYVSEKAAQDQLRASTDAQREAMWRQVEGAAAGPWFLGERLSAIDLYLWAMVRWRPRRPWFTAEAPKIAAIAAALDADPRLAGVKARNFP
ncbi:MAG: glutathione S-transferase family protein [Byssovorax sp.]